MSNPLPIPLKVMSGWRTKQRPAHEGIDLTAPVGTPVLSIGDGWVTLVTGDTGPAGNSIIVQHSHDDETRYNHLRHRPDFTIGETVKAGEQIGVVGMTGRTDAPHLHFARYRLRGFRWRDVDPTSVLDFSSAAGGGGKPFDPEEDDMFTDEDRAKLNAVYSAIFGSRNLTGKDTETSWVAPNGRTQSTKYGMLPILIETQRMVDSAE